jgi:hypothetical protein
MHSDRDPDQSGNGIWSFRAANQVHAGLFRSAPALLMVALEAACNDIIPCLTPSLDDRNNVIEGQVLGGTPVAAVLASMAIPGVDVGSAEFHLMEAFSGADKSEEAKDAGHPDGKADAAYLPVILRKHFDLALEQQGKGAFPVNDINGLITGVENECLFHR